MGYKANKFVSRDVTVLTYNRLIFFIILYAINMWYKQHDKNL